MSENTVNETEVVADAAAVESVVADTANEPREARRGGRERNPNKDRNRDRIFDAAGDLLTLNVGD